MHKAKIKTYAKIVEVMDSSRVWKFVKYLAFSVMIVLGVVLLVQYISLAKLTNQSNALDSEYSKAQTEYNEKSDFKKDLEDNYNQYVEDKCKENENMKYDNEEVLY